MNVAELVNAVAKETSLTKADTRNVINAALNTIMNAVKKGDSVRLTSFGTFKKVKYAARKGINPQSGEPLKIKARTAPKFVAGKNFKAAINSSK